MTIRIPQMRSRIALIFADNHAFESDEPGGGMRKSSVIGLPLEPVGNEGNKLALKTKELDDDLKEAKEDKAAQVGVFEIVSIVWNVLHLERCWPITGKIFCINCKCFGLS